MKALYVHVPFCDSICAYCDFCRVGKNDSLIEKWLNALEIEVKDRLKKKAYDTIYIGGGTPTCLSEKQLTKLLKLIKPYTSKCIEYTIEINPESLTIEKCQLLKKYKINRASVGVQTTSQELLNLIGRRHTKRDVKNSIEWLRAVGIENISCDCMYSLPTQRIEDVNDTLNFLFRQKIPHISIYSLTIEEHSRFKREGYMPLDEDLEADMYDFIIEKCDAKKYKQYEISNFCKEGYESKHNLHYWNYDDFVGISIGASGKEEHCRYDCTKNFEEYFRHNYFKEIIPLAVKDEMFEIIMMGLRLKKGFDISQFKPKFSFYFDDVYKEEKEEAIRKGLLIQEGDILRCSDVGYKICNTVIEMFMK